MTTIGVAVLGKLVAMKPAAVCGAAGALILAACGGVPAAEYASVVPTATTSARPTADFNEADVTFTQMMIVHHEAAIAMSRAEQQHGENSQAKQLAGEIATTQQAQADQMRKLLDELP